MKIQANTIRPGNVIEYGDKQWTVLKTEILLPGKGNAFIQVEMRDVKSGNKTNERFRTAETVEKLMVEEKDATVRLPQHVAVEVIEADPVVKGQTASSSYKPAVVENGVRVMVPPHIEAGTRIVVNTEDTSYVERAKD